MAASYRPAAEEQDTGNDSDEEVRQLDDDETIQVGRAKENDEGRDDKLRATLFELRKMNEVFEGFLGALEGVKEHNEVSMRLGWMSGGCHILLILHLAASCRTNISDIGTP